MNKLQKKYKKMISDSNTVQKIRLRTKPTINGFLSIYLDLWHNDKREYRTLDFKLACKKETAKEDAEKIFVAITIRQSYEQELIQQQVDFSLANNLKQDADFCEYLEKFYLSKKDATYFGIIKHFKKHINNKPIAFKNINRTFCEGFKEYLLKSSEIKKSTADIYMQMFKTVLRRAVSEKLLKEYPCEGISIKPTASKREFLSDKEIECLIKTPMPNRDVCNAFLFSCFTGLRISDLLSLRFENIQDGLIYFRQQKTQEDIRNKMPVSALKIYELMHEIKQGKGLIFKLKMCTSGNNDYIKKWVRAAGITKHITFHCARHTFATLCLTHNIEIFTVSKLLGHKDLKTTQIYAKLIDLKKDEAVAKLPDFFDKIIK